ncbi:hypothetical protein PR202_ga25973 [Eleusine coracana subsp. coracana]|uniref:Uncharacterized protein n=1 Tax=Eleusine coracana subsp. coracana TaxID=191504 RepID=A0AAV5DD21_ELECO|nr:hypothetical protein PR202_ga25973 [Eleusine coracana subsp. coracana]
MHAALHASTANKQPSRLVSCLCYDLYVLRGILDVSASHCACTTRTWKQQVIFSDPNRVTADWVGPAVCNYTGVFCAPVPRGLPGAWELAVAVVDLNHGDIAGCLPSELGPIPREIFDRPLDAIFLNHNRLRSPLPENIDNSPASIIVLAENHFGGCLPASLGNMSDSLNEIRPEVEQRRADRRWSRGAPAEGRERGRGRGRRRRPPEGVARVESCRRRWSGSDRLLFFWRVRCFVG